MLKRHILNQRADYSKQHRQKTHYWFLSAVTSESYRILSSLIRRYVSGSVLDAGCGYGAWKTILLEKAQGYTSLDGRQDSGADHIGDLQNMPVFKDQSFDVVFCAQVFEYLPAPQQALLEFSRVLKPSGLVIISAPFLAPLHDEPYDLFRYSVDGLRQLLVQNNFEVLESQKVGGLFCFITHPASIIILGLFGNILILGSIVRFLNRILIIYPAVMLDRLLSLNQYFFSNTMIVARKKADN